MERRKIGTLEVTVVGLGCNNFGGRLDKDATRTVVDAALDAGINFFDTADVYGGTLSEEYLGAALGSRRKDIVLTTKFGTRLDDERHGASPAYVRRALTDSLSRLGTDWLDLYQLHRPDPETPIAETLGALRELVDEGLVREIGCSNMALSDLEEADAVGGAGFVSLQNEYSLLERKAEAGVLEWCARHDVGFIPFFPLASGLLTGKYRRGEEPPAGTRLGDAPPERQDAAFTEVNFDRIEALEHFAATRGHSLLELAFSWLLARTPVVSVIAGATRPEQVGANVAAASWQLSPAEVEEVAALSA